MTNQDMARMRRGSDYARSSGELLVVDPTVDDVATLLDGRRADVELLRLVPGGRGLEQIAGHLAGRRDITALHILSHGEPGALLLAGERVDLPGLVKRPGVLADIADALAEDARVVLYGCSVAAGPAGRAFLDFLEASLDVRVAASVGPVGAATLAAAGPCVAATARQSSRSSHRRRWRSMPACWRARPAPPATTS